MDFKMNAYEQYQVKEICDKAIAPVGCLIVPIVLWLLFISIVVIKFVGGWHKAWELFTAP